MTRRISFHAWASAAELGLGTHDGTRLEGDLLRIAQPTATRDYADPHGDGTTARYEQSTWTSPEVEPGFAATELIPSWNARTPAGSWLEVSVSAALADGTRTGWYVLGRWAESDSDIHPTSVPDQDDRHATVDVDRLCLEQPLVSYRLRVALLRRVGSTASPSVSLLGAMVSDEAGEGVPQQSAGPAARGMVVEVPSYSQMLHRGEYPQWDAGGESWCSPTSTTMILSHWGRGPEPADYAWVEPSYQDRFIDYAARHTFDYAYRGAGNWAFNTAYAARFGVIAYVTRLRDLTEAEQFIRAGIPLVASVAFEEDELDGAGYDTKGHLLTIVGFDEHGNVVSNDPASHGIADNDQVRTTYDRGQFERAWLGSAGGVVYVIHPRDVTPPAPGPEANWLTPR